MSRIAIVGSGFGGSIAAARFTAAGHTVQLVEMGERLDSAKMRQSQDTRYIFRLFRDYPADYLMSKPKLVVTQGMGYGGGSVVYSAIHVRAPASAFVGWPTGYTRQNLDPYYARAEAALAVRTYSEPFPRRTVFAQGAAAAGLPAPRANPLAIQECTFCGWCVPACVWGKKQTLATNYLARAAATGRLTIHTRYKAMEVEKRGAGYRVRMHSTSSRNDNYHLIEHGSGTWHHLDADVVVIACGSIESPALLLRSTSFLNRFDTAKLGKDIDGQGDAATGGFVPQITDSHKGAIMMDHIDMGDYVLEDIHSVPVGIGVKYPVSFSSLGDKDWGLAYKQKLRNYTAHMLGIAIVGKSPSGANITVSDSKGVAQVSSSAYAPPAGAVDAARSIIRALGGEVANTPYDRRGQMATVHPTGGCKMGSVVDPHNLQVYNNPNLYVIDGSVLPWSTYRNPANTIAAVAEKAMDVILGENNPPPW